MATLADHARGAMSALVLGVGLLVRVVFLAGADEQALVRVVPDDAYYYFKVARNIAAGQGATFDGIHPTNGYHPLWMGVLVPVAAVVREPLLFVRVALSLGVALSFATAVLLYRLVRRLTDAWWIPLFALILYWLNPRAVISSLNGLETSLSTLLFTALLLLVMRICDFRQEPGTQNLKWLPCLLGVLMGTLFLARTDNVFFVAAFWLAVVAMAERGRRLRRGLVMAGAAAALAVPWMAYNWVTFGSPVQVSGLAIPYVEHELYRLQGHSGGDALLYSLKRFAVMLYEGLRGEIGYSRLVSFPALAVAVVIFAVRWRDEAAMPRARRRAVLVLAALGLASLLHLFVHAAVRWYPRPWYFDQMLVLLPVVFALALAAACGANATAFQTPNTEHRTSCAISHVSRFTHHALGGLMAALLLALASVQATLSFRRLAEGEWPWAVEMLDAARWLRDNTGKDEVAAAFNAGIIGYYSERRVVNLDGAINNAAYEALRRKELMGLMRRANVSYYLDFEPMTLRRFGPFLGSLSDIEQMPVVRRFNRPGAAWEGSHILVIKMTWPSEGTKER